MFCTNNCVHLLFSLSKNLWQADSFFSLPPLVVLVSSFSCPVRNYYHCTRPVLAVLGNLDLFLVSSNVYDSGWIPPPSLFRRKKKNFKKSRIEYKATPPECQFVNTAKRIYVCILMLIYIYIYIYRSKYPSIKFFFFSINCRCNFEFEVA